MPRSTQWARDAAEITRKARTGICQSCGKSRPLRNLGDDAHPVMWCQWCVASHNRKFKRSR